MAYTIGSIISDYVYGYNPKDINPREYTGQALMADFLVSMILIGIGASYLHEEQGGAGSWALVICGAVIILADISMMVKRVRDYLEDPCRPYWDTRQLEEQESIADQRETIIAPERIAFLRMITEAPTLNETSNLLDEVLVVEVLEKAQE